jgi:ADP-ribose pyrophosphatase YjhB (NUDIX family)
MKYCYECGSTLEKIVPEGDNLPRGVCSNPSCDYIHYINPKVIVGTIPRYQNKIMLCKRAIEPCYGKWTLPAGFMECHEDSSEGAARETLEEAGAHVEIDQLFRMYDLPHISQIYLFYLASMNNLKYEAGEESLEVALFTEDEIPWDELAFPVIGQVLKEFFEKRQHDVLSFENTTFNVKKVLK